MTFLERFDSTVEAVRNVSFGITDVDPDDINEEESEKVDNDKLIEDVDWLVGVLERFRAGVVAFHKMAKM